MAKGEGSRGGKIIGHTKSGRAIYAGDNNRAAIRRSAKSGAALGVTLLAMKEAGIGYLRTKAFRRVGQTAQANAHRQYAVGAAAVGLGAAAISIGYNVGAAISRTKDNKDKDNTYVQRQVSGLKDLGASLVGTAGVAVGGTLGIKGLSMATKAAKKAAPVVQAEYKFRAAKKVVSGAGSSTGKIAGLLGYTKGKK